jgi:hypothetical protein
MVDVMFKVGAYTPAETYVNKLINIMFKDEGGRYGTVVRKRKPSIVGRMMGEKPISKRMTYEMPQQQPQPGGVTVGPKGKIKTYMVQEPEVYTVRGGKSSGQSTQPGFWSRYGKYVGPALGIGALGGLMLAPKVAD